MNDAIALVGGVDVSVKFKMDGRTESVRVRELSVDELPKFAAIQDDEVAMIELCTDKTAGWAKTVTRDSHVALIKAVEEVNGGFFQEWAERIQKREERLMPGITARKIEALTSAVAQAAGKK